MLRFHGTLNSIQKSKTFSETIISLSLSEYPVSGPSQTKMLKNAISLKGNQMFSRFSGSILLSIAFFEDLTKVVF